MNETRRNLIGAGLTTPLLGGCIFGDDVFIEWDEEVLLHDQTTMMVHVKYRWERLSRGFTPKGGSFIDRDSWLTFDAGGPNGKVNQFFKGWKPRFIGQSEGIWYVWLTGGSYRNFEAEPGQNWNLSQEHAGEFGVLRSGAFVPIPRSQFPKEFTLTNFFRLKRQPETFFPLRGQKLTLAKKQEWPDKWNTYAYQIHNHP